MAGLIIPANLDSLETIRKYVQDAATVVGLVQKDSYRLRLAVDEVATNIITHGYDGMEGEHTIEVNANTGEDALSIELLDSGAHFDPRSVPEPTFDLPIQERQIGGMGLYLAIRGVDDFVYERAGERNRNVFTIKLPNRGARP